MQHPSSTSKKFDVVLQSSHEQICILLGSSSFTDSTVVVGVMVVFSSRDKRGGMWRQTNWLDQRQTDRNRQAERHEQSRRPRDAKTDTKKCVISRTRRWVRQHFDISQNSLPFVAKNARLIILNKKRTV